MTTAKIILGAGATGLAASLVTHNVIYEAEKIPGGICSTYYLRSGDSERKFVRRVDEDDFRFELGGGHWLFGISEKVQDFLNRFGIFKTHSRKASIYFSSDGTRVPYPLQHHLSYLAHTLREKASKEILNPLKKSPESMGEWLRCSFGTTLFDLFFGPFHNLYTAGLTNSIAPQDDYKSPIDKEQVIRGLVGKPIPVGYNVSFQYPYTGLGNLFQRIARECTIEYEKRVTHIYPDKRHLVFEDGENLEYSELYSTLPLNRMQFLTGIETNHRKNPSTSVLVLNIGAKRGSKCPDDHWIYIPSSQSGFHRVGFYSNVDKDFLPRAARKDEDLVSLYVERSFQEGQKPSDESIHKYQMQVVEELREWDMITELLVIDPTWIETAYTWSYPNSNWVPEMLSRLESYRIYQLGRYGRWHFQGIAESIREGLEVGHLKNSSL